jgi:hypothetical protein
VSRFSEHFINLKSASVYTFQHSADNDRPTMNPECFWNRIAKAQGSEMDE